MYADLQKLLNGAECVQDLEQHFHNTRKLLDTGIITQNMFGSFPLALECAEKTRNAHKVLCHNAAQLAQQCTEIRRKTIDMINQISCCDNDSAHKIYTAHLIEPFPKNPDYD